MFSSTTAACSGLFLLSDLTFSTTTRKPKNCSVMSSASSFNFETSYLRLLNKRVGVVRRSKGLEGGEGENWDLEEEILEFMKKSDKPEAFPSKKELVDAGRIDLVNEIQKQGGWLSLGWDLGDNNMEDDVRESDFETRFDVGEVNISFEGSEFTNLGVNANEINSSSSGTSLDAEAEEDTGIQGILNRLEKERSLSFGLGLRDIEVTTDVSNDDNVDDWQPGSSTDATVAGHDRSSRPTSLSLSHLGIKINHNRFLSDLHGSENSVKADMGKNWSIQKASFSTMEFEAAEVVLHKSQGELSVEASTNGLLLRPEASTEPLDRTNELESCRKESGHNSIHVQTRLKSLDLELSSALQLLRSKSEDIMTQTDHEKSSEEFRRLSDAWEFQENEIINTQSRLRTIHAKLAILEGKMALVISDAQKLLEEKQKRIDDARRVLQVLRSACIVWPNSASEVFLAGSFDGWTTQRKMEKSNTGIFSLCLKLYPGTYEIKFIVDGVWKIDPLRPVVQSDGFENNLLTIT